MARRLLLIGFPPSASPSSYLSFVSSLVPAPAQYFSSTDNPLVPLLPPTPHFDLQEALNFPLAPPFPQSIPGLDPNTNAICLVSQSAVDQTIAIEVSESNNTAIGIDLPVKKLILWQGFEAYCADRGIPIQGNCVDISELAYFRPRLSQSATAALLSVIQQTALQRTEGDIRDFQARLGAVGEGNDYGKVLETVCATMEQGNAGLGRVRDTAEGTNALEELKTAVEEVRNKSEEVRMSGQSECNFPTMYIERSSETGLLVVNFKRNFIEEVMIEVGIREDEMEVVNIVRVSPGAQVVELDVGRRRGAENKVCVRLKTGERVASNLLEWMFDPRRGPGVSNSPQISNPSVEEVKRDEYCVATLNRTNRTSRRTDPPRSLPSWQSIYPPLIPPSADITRIITPEEQALFENLMEMFPDLKEKPNILIRFMGIARHVRDLTKIDDIVGNLLDY